MKLFNILVGDNSFEVNHKFLNLVIIASFLISIIGLITNIFTLPNTVTILFPIIYGLLQIFLYYFARFRRQYKIPALISVIFLIFILTPFLWVFMGGTKGSTFFLTVIVYLFIVIIFTGKQRILFFISLLTIVLGLIVFEYCYPQYIQLYDSELARIMDISISYFLFIILSIIIFTFYIELYNKEHLKITELNKKLQLLVTIDSMTGLYNHEYILNMLNDEIHRTKRYNNSLSIIMFDLDHFKSVNDVFGHLTGDNVLRAISRIFNENLRPPDKAGRYGGEEFLIVMPETTLMNAVKIAERLRIKIASHDFGTNTVTISGGVAELIDEDIQKLINRADNLLYKAKKNGRNRIEQ